MRRSGGRRMSFWRSLAAVSPVRIPTSGATKLSPRRSAASSIPFSGARRFFSMSKASARSGEMYSTRVRCDRSSGRGVVVSRSIDARNAVSVLPDPVGAQISVCSPAAMCGQPCTCGGVGSGNDAANHSRTAGENAASTGWSAIRPTYPPARPSSPGLSGPDPDRPAGWISRPSSWRSRRRSCRPCRAP